MAFERYSMRYLRRKKPGKPLNMPQGDGATFAGTTRSTAVVPVIGPGGNRGEDNMSDDLTRRMGNLEEKVGVLSVDVGKATERLNHMPTSADLLKVVSGAQWKIIGSVTVLAAGLIAKALWPHITF
jgi:hypothetical protein